MQLVASAFGFPRCALVSPIIFFGENRGLVLPPFFPLLIRRNSVSSVLSSLFFIPPRSDLQTGVTERFALLSLLMILLYYRVEIFGDGEGQQWIKRNSRCHKQNCFSLSNSAPKFDRNKLKAPWRILKLLSPR